MHLLNLDLSRRAAAAAAAGDDADGAAAQVNAPRLRSCCASPANLTVTVPGDTGPCFSDHAFLVYGVMEYAATRPWHPQCLRLEVMHTCLAGVNLITEPPVGCTGVVLQAAIAAAKKLTKTEKEKTLQQLVADGWLRHSQTQSGHYCIGVSSLAVSVWSPRNKPAACFERHCMLCSNLCSASVHHCQQGLQQEQPLVHDS